MAFKGTTSNKYNDVGVDLFLSSHSKLQKPGLDAAL